MKIKLSEDVEIPVELVAEEGDNESQVTLADFLGVFSSTIGWIADILAYQQLMHPGEPSPNPPLPPFVPFKMKNIQDNTEFSLPSDLTIPNINKLNFDIPQNKDDIIIYLLLIIVSSLNDKK